MKRCQQSQYHSGRPRSLSKFERLLHQPGKVLIIAVVFAMSTLLFKGSLSNLYTLHRDKKRLIAEIEESRLQITKLSEQINRVKDPQFIEKQAMEKLDLADENDLVFVFSDE